MEEQTQIEALALPFEPAPAPEIEQAAEPTPAPEIERAAEPALAPEMQAAEPAPAPQAEAADAEERPPLPAEPPALAASGSQFEPEPGPIAAEPAAEPEHLRVALGELEDGQRVRGVYAVRERELKRKRNGEPWLRLSVGDATGTAEAVCWEDAEVLFAQCSKGCAIHLTGTFEMSERWGAKIKLTALREAAAHEYETDDLAPPSPVSAERLESDLRGLLDTIEDTQLRQLLDYFFGELSPAWHRFRDAPAAKVYHQAYRHGLLEHSLSVAQAVYAAAEFFPGIDREVAVAGALLHDIGKCVAYNDDPLAIDLTDAGRLEGEIPLGYYTVRRQIEEIEGFDLATARALLHIILAHHGSLEHGSPVAPATREAVLVHMMDNLGGRLGSFDRLERQLPAGESWSGFDRALSGSAFFGNRQAA